MTRQEFLNILAKLHIERIEALNQPFDPNVHQSIASTPSADAEPNTVVVETQAGFKLHDRVVRPAQVVLAAPAPNVETNESAQER